MEALSVIVNSKIVAGDTRRSVAGDLPFDRPRRHPLRAVRRRLSRRAVAASQGVGRPRLVAQSSGD
ncbi:hypothetical protein EV644_104336 [Kribbella orskensis]|uniref:Uncharacterized protein n=1 Tax=Kribbella orskensis TaxID=2512216 RepID=A0ABY2BNP1_9ACTN|nr:hypothetical protein EV642_103336 [Kribbella sp. VKM Ac-2500]TCO25832.1 hypothetical protein EV644_104336 [Kribbella orskensis]